MDTYCTTRMLLQYFSRLAIPGRWMSFLVSAWYGRREGWFVKHVFLKYAQTCTNIPKLCVNHIYKRYCCDICKHAYTCAGCVSHEMTWNFWHVFDCFLHFMAFALAWRRKKANRNSAVMRDCCITSTGLEPPGAFKSTLKAAPILVRQARLHGRWLRNRLQSILWKSHRPSFPPGCYFHTCSRFPVQSHAISSNHCWIFAILLCIQCTLSENHTEG